MWLSKALVLFLCMCHIFHGISGHQEAEVSSRIKRQSELAERGEKFATFAKEFVTMFGESGLKIKSVMGIANKLGPLLGPVGPIFSIIGLFGDSQPSVQEIKDTVVQGFNNMKHQLQEVQVKLDKIYKLLLETSQFQMIEYERSLLNGIEEAVNKAVQYPENSTRRLLRRYCEQAFKAPVDILRRLNEYVHKDSFPPKLRDALFSFAAGSSAKIAIVTKQILADVVRAILFKQTCLGIESASDKLKQTISNEDQEIFQNLTKTFLEWEEAFVPDFMLNGELNKDAVKILDNAKSWVYFEPLQSYLEARINNIAYDFEHHSYKYHWNGRTGDQKNPENVRMSFVLIEKDHKTKIDILNPHKAAIFEGVLREKPVQLVVAWNGYKENLSAAHDRILAGRGKLDSLFQTSPSGWSKSNQKRLYQYYCFYNQTSAINLENGQLDGVLMDMDAAVMATVPEGTVIVKDWQRNFGRKGETDPIFFGQPCKRGRNEEKLSEERNGVLIML